MTATDTAAQTNPTAASAAAPSWGTRIWNVVRLQGANPWTAVWWPLIVMSVIFLAHYAIYAMIAYANGGTDGLPPEAFQTSGGSSWIIVYLMVVAIQAMSLTFRFALGLSVTRRDYFVGTVLFFTIVSVGLAAGMTIMAAIERASGGWGLGIAFFAPALFHDYSVGMVFCGWLVGCVLMFGLGVAFATVWVRWRAQGVTLTFIGLGAAIIAAIWLITWSHAWSAIGSFLTDTPLPELMAWSLVVPLVGNVAGYLLLRRATSRD